MPRNWFPRPTWRPETARDGGDGVVVLITQRSEAQILPRLLISAAQDPFLLAERAFSRVGCCCQACVAVTGFRAAQCGQLRLPRTLLTSSEVSRAMTAVRVAGSRASSWSWMSCTAASASWCFSRTTAISCGRCAPPLTSWAARLILYVLLRARRTSATRHGCYRKAQTSGRGGPAGIRWYSKRRRFLRSRRVRPDGCPAVDS